MVYENVPAVEGLAAGWAGKPDFEPEYEPDFAGKPAGNVLAEPAMDLGLLPHRLPVVVQPVRSWVAALLPQSPVLLLARWLRSGNGLLAQNP